MKKLVVIPPKPGPKAGDKAWAEWRVKSDAAIKANNEANAEKEAFLATLPDTVSDIVKRLEKLEKNAGK